VLRAADAALGKKALELAVLDLRKLADFTDWFVICHGTSDRQVLAIADGIEEQLWRECRRRPSHVEGRRAADWVLLDYVDFVVHVFRPETRSYYRLENLWGDAPRVRVGEDLGPSERSSRASR
jgi:ribosome-associated protein